MYKQKLQELCQKLKWEIPKYSTTKYGFDHSPLFKSSVSVNGVSFSSPSSSSSSKQSQNDAAEIAFLHFTSTSPSPNQDSHCRYKKQLHNYAQWKNLETPFYCCLTEGPSHAPQFRATVLINGHAFETPLSFSTSDEAENACAEMALSSIATDDFEEGNPSFYKNLLLEFAQKEGISKPQYNTINIGAPHIPIFYSFVEIHGDKYYGRAGKSKKAAESSAAKVAYLCLEENGMIAKDYSPCYEGDPTEIQNGICDLTISGSNGEGPISDNE